MNEKLSFTYQLHFATEDSTIKWKESFSKYLMYDTEDPLDIYKENGTYNSSFEPTYYGFFNSEINNKILPNEANRVLGKPSVINALDTQDEISALTVTPQKDFDGYALVLPKTMEILFSITKELKQNEEIILPKITFSNIKTIIKN